MYMHGHIFSRPKGTYSELITAYYKWCAKRCYPQTDLIFALSKQQRSLAIQAEADPEKVHVIPNGIGLDQIGLTESMVHNRRDLFSKDTLSLLYLGRCSAEKGFDTLIEACALLSNWHIDFQLTVVGGAEMSEFALGRVKELKSKDQVIVRKAVERSDVGAELLNTDILCIPSIDEALGNVVLESMISECAVIGSNAGGIPDMIEDGRTGYLFPVGNSHKLAETILWCKKNPSKVIQATRFASDMVHQKYSWRKVTDKLSGLMLESLNC